MLTVSGCPDLNSEQLVALICGNLFPKTHTFDRSFKNRPFDDSAPGNSYLFQRTKSVSSGPYVFCDSD